MTTKQEQALAALMTCPTRKAAAEASGITDRTLRGYFADKEFRQRYREQCNGIMEEAALRSKKILEKSISKLEEIMDDNTINAGIQRQAAKDAAEIALRLEECVNIKRELEELRGIVFPESEGVNENV